MKRFQLAFFFSVFAIVLGIEELNGQNFVTDPIEVIKEHFDSHNVEYLINRTLDGSECLHFREGEITVEYYFNDEGICVIYRTLFPKEGLAESLDALNASFTKLKVGIWREYDGLQYFIRVLDKTISGYSLSVFTEVSLKGVWSN
ncbi:hypothetical protein K8352_18790 [Flavobacteriaceae bacterium F89]|uniref:Uncharacterized protein n=1 Tax=Cerina litoralis TaxID=2874477 RepID=A0AAE3EXP5_9FLAO|nr:hypothetical protein [Cerina litoralis]MCG2462818.1 hypothetical protein [Cerina litoralis]